MHENFIMWLGGLDSKNRERLANHLDRGCITFDEHKEKYKGYYENIDNIVGDMVAVGSKNQRKGE